MTTTRTYYRIQFKLRNEARWGDTSTTRDTEPEADDAIGAMLVDYLPCYDFRKVRVTETREVVADAPGR